MTTPPAQGRPPAAGSTLAVCPRSRTGHPAAPPLARAAAGCRLAHRPPLLTAMLSGVSAPASLTRETAPSQMDTAAQRILLHHIRPRQIAAATAARHSCRGSSSRHPGRVRCLLSCPFGCARVRCVGPHARPPLGSRHCTRAPAISREHRDVEWTVPTLATSCHRNTARPPARHPPLDPPIE